MALSEEVRKELSDTVSENRVVLFMKGKRRLPQCGFSAQVVKILDDLLDDYLTVNVLENPDVRDGVKQFSNWPTIPQLYVGGKFVGGCDIVSEMYRNGELHQALGIQLPEVKEPTLSITDAAAHALKGALEQAPEGSCVRLEVDGSFRPAMGVDGPNATDFRLEVNGIPFVVDRMSAPRADGIAMDFLPGEQGGFRIDNPNEPPRVRNISVDQVSQWLQEGQEFELVDVRTDAERDIAKIEGAVQYTPQERERLMGLPKDRILVFHCHHGSRSLEAGQEFAAEGFRRVFNMEGGIDAWALKVDNTLRRY